MALLVLALIGNHLKPDVSDWDTTEVHAYIALHWTVWIVGMGLVVVGVGKLMKLVYEGR